jgi:excisionase family DNA binding protein
MLRLITPSGIFEASDQQAIDSLLAALTQAEQATLSKVYSIATLATRLAVSPRSAYDLIREGKIRYACAGSKNYRVSELAVREFLGDK